MYFVDTDVTALPSSKTFAAYNTWRVGTAPGATALDEAPWVALSDAAWPTNVTGATAAAGGKGWRTYRPRRGSGSWDLRGASEARAACCTLMPLS